VISNEESLGEYVPLENSGPRGSAPPKPFGGVTPFLLRWCGPGAVLAGLLFGAWGYVDRVRAPALFETLEAALSSVVPALFLAGVVGLFALCVGEVGTLGRVGLVLALCGPGRAIASFGVDLGPLYVHLAKLGWPTHLLDWLFIMLAGLALAGVAAVRTRVLRGLGVLLILTVALGWIFSSTDSGTPMEARAVHVTTGSLFCLCWAVLGLRLYAAGVSPAGGGVAGRSRRRSPQVGSS
jgi:hypothetical protein